MFGAPFSNVRRASPRGGECHSLSVLARCSCHSAFSMPTLCPNFNSGPSIACGVATQPAWNACTSLT
eukprot:6202506-Pleurochrysis_carterae.AAC.6